jgi:hypothetical protein
VHRQLHAALYDGGQTEALPSPVQRHDAGHREAVQSGSIPGRQVAGVANVVSLAPQPHRAVVG